MPPAARRDIAHRDHRRLNGAPEVLITPTVGPLPANPARSGR